MANEVFPTPLLAIRLFLCEPLNGYHERGVITFSAEKIATCGFGFFFLVFGDEVEEDIFHA
jgi:hypothetical protein